MSVTTLPLTVSKTKVSVTLRPVSVKVDDATDLKLAVPATRRDVSTNPARGSGEYAPVSPLVWRKRSEEPVSMRTAA